MVLFRILTMLHADTGNVCLNYRIAVVILPLNTTLALLHNLNFF